MTPADQWQSNGLGVRHQKYGKRIESQIPRVSLTVDGNWLLPVSLPHLT